MILPWTLARRIPPIVAIASLAPWSLADEWDELPRRHPEHAIKNAVEISIPWSSLGYGDGRREVFDGNVALLPEKEGERTLMRVVTDMEVLDEEGDLIDLPGGAVRLTPEGEPAGGPESLGDRLSAAARYSLVSDSDFALMPLRMLFRHEMPSGSGGAAEKVREDEHFRVEWSERFLGVKLVSMTRLQTYEVRTLRTHKESGWQVLDYLQTFEDERDDTVLAAFGVRMFVHPTRLLPDGREAPSGVHHLAVIKTFQLDWRQEREVIEPRTWEPLVDDWFRRLSDPLFFSLDDEGVGDPLDSPSAFALGALHLLDARTLARFMRAGSAKALAAIAPHVARSPVAYDPAPLARAAEESTDPVRRLLLATAAAACTGEFAASLDPESARRRASYLRLARVGLHSSSARVRLAAAGLAYFLRDESLVPALRHATVQPGGREARVRALLALGATGGPAARDAIEAAMRSSEDDRVLAAAFRALADTGLDGVEERFGDARARAGALSADTGMFEVVIGDAPTAAPALREIAALARAARAGDERAVFEHLQANLRHEFSDEPFNIAVGDASREWLFRLDALVPGLADDVTDPNVREVARNIAAASGRGAVEEILRRIRATRDRAEKTRLCILAGCTGDPRAREFLSAMQDADDLADYEAASEGLQAMEESIR